MAKGPDTPCACSAWVALYSTVFAPLSNRDKRGHESRDGACVYFGWVLGVWSIGFYYGADHWLASGQHVESVRSTLQQ